MDRSTVISLVKLQAATGVYPTLSDTEVGTLVDQTARWSGSWAASTPYVFGDAVIPTIPNGHVYRCVNAGRSGTAEPDWTAYATVDSRLALTVPYWSTWNGFYGSSGIVSDGTVTWAEAGPASEQYSVRDATHQAWLLKASKASADYDVAEQDGDTLKRSQVMASCERMATRFAPVGIA
jgi:hypothetical protein